MHQSTERHEREQQKASEEVNFVRQRQGGDKLRRRLEQSQRVHPGGGGVNKPRRAPAIDKGKDQPKEDLRK